MNSEILNILFVIIILAAVIFAFIRIAVKIRRGGGNFTTLMYGATDEFYNKDKKKAIEQVVEQKAGKKMTEDTSGESK